MSEILSLSIDDPVVLESDISQDYNYTEFEEFRKAHNKKWHADYRKLIKVSKTPNK